MCIVILISLKVMINLIREKRVHFSDINDINHPVIKYHKNHVV